jgi:pimeloyl-ACP methyl ester carboxylesterase
MFSHFCEKSALTSCVQAAQEYMKPFTNLKTHVFKNAAHNVMYDAPKGVAEEMLKFVYKYYCQSY